VSKNVIVINELIEKVTMRVGKQKVTIKKKKYREPIRIKAAEKESEITLDEDADAELPPPDRKNSFTSVYNSKLQKETMLHSDDIIVEKKDAETGSKVEGGEQ